MTATVVLLPGIDDAPIVQAPVYHGQALKVAVNTVEVATTSLDETNDRVMLLALPAQARIIDLILFNDDLDTNVSPALTLDIGVFYKNQAGQTAGGVVAEACIANNLTTGQAANTAGVRVLTNAVNIDDIGKPLWEVAGLTTNPGGDLYIGISVETAAATAAAGTVTLVCHYC